MGREICGLSRQDLRKVLLNKMYSEFFNYYVKIYLGEQCDGTPAISERKDNQKQKECKK